MTRGYLSLHQVAERWACSPDTARARLAECPRIKLGRLVRYAIEGVEALEQEAIRNPGKPAHRRRMRAASADAERLDVLRRKLGWV